MTGLLDSNFAVPPFRVLNAIKLIETISRINVEYPANLQTFFNSLTKFRIAKETVNPFYLEASLTISKGKLTRTVPKFTPMGMLKTVLFLFLFMTKWIFDLLYKLIVRKYLVRRVLFCNIAL